MRGLNYIGSLLMALGGSLRKRFQAWHVPFAGPTISLPAKWRTDSRPPSLGLGCLATKAVKETLAGVIFGEPLLPEQVLPSEQLLPHVTPILHHTVYKD